jgi:hypothetical protein
LFSCQNPEQNRLAPNKPVIITRLHALSIGRFNFITTSR